MSSECTVKTGAILAMCSPDGKATAIEDIGLADDRGHTFLANLYSIFTGRAIDRKGLTVMNIVLNAIAFYGLILSFFVYGWKVTALLLLLFGSTLAVPGPYPNADAPAAYIAAFCLAMVAVTWVAHVPLGEVESPTVGFLAGLILAVFCLGWSTLLRQPYGIGGLLVIALILAVRLLRTAWRHEFDIRRTLSWRSAAVILCLTLAALHSTTTLIMVREGVFGISRGERVIDHGISHNLYLGLGVENNPWGIKWDDLFGYESAARVGNAQYASEEHYANLRRLYFYIVLRDPIAVLKIYINKLGKSLLVVVDDNRRKLFAWAVGVLVLVSLVMWSRRGLKGDDMVFTLAVWGGFGSVMLQGVLALPWSGFISPGKLAALCGIVVLLEVVGRSVHVRLGK